MGYLARLEAQGSSPPQTVNILWTALARSDLAALHAFISESNERAADAMVERIVIRAERQLLRLPESGRPGRIAKTRELIVSGTPYILPYRIVGDTVQILRVYHHARRWPDVL
jgi:toxin ParE1/3/4